MNLGKIAKALGVDVLYLLTYPHVYVKKELTGKSEPAEAVLQIKLTGDKKETIIVAFSVLAIYNPPKQVFTKFIHNL
jgi:hypothetical protein